MKADFSRVTFKPERHYRSVLMQQGRVTVDADPNEQAEIVNHRADETTADVVGPTGRPKGEFSVTVSGGNLSITDGTLYLDGIPCVNDADCTLTTQPFLPLDSANPTDFPDLAAGAGNYAVYLVAYERAITAVEDPEIRETALGGADTSVRSQWVWQIRMRRFDPPANTTCANVGTSWMPGFQPGALTARAVPAQAVIEQCVLPPAAEYRRLENQLYRVEIHRGGNRSQATFKWSRENGSVVTALRNSNPPVAQTAGPILLVETTGRDADVGFGAGQWVELLDDAIELRRASPPGLSQIDEPRPAVREIELTAAAPQAVRFDRRPKLRRWDHQGGTADGLPLGNGAEIALEDGVVVSFSAGDYRPGDYWLIPARTAINDETGRIEWPSQAGNPAAVPSRLREHMCLLTVVNWNGNALTAVNGFGQCVPEFPPLTAIQASDVHYTPGCNALQNTSTVQQALDTLCTLGGVCTITVRPGAGWEQPILALPDNANAEICFAIGDYPTPVAGVVVQGKGILKVTGAGAGTRINNAQGEMALQFRNCASVTVRDLFVRAQTTGAADLNGALTFIDCPDVVVEAVCLESGDNSRRHASCLTVRNSIAANSASVTPSLRVRGSLLLAGQQQYGILGVNLTRAHIEDNTIVCTRQTLVRTIPELLQDPFIVTEASNNIASNIRILKAGEAPRNEEATFAFAGRTIAFKADPAVREPWQRYLAAHPPPSGARISDATKHVKILANQLARDQSRWTEFPGVAQVFRAFQTLPLSGFRGVCLAGDRLQEARILNNTIKRFRHGIHVGLSHSEPAQGTPDAADSVLIGGNRIEVQLIPGDDSPVGEKRPRAPHAIYAGNVRNLVISENHALLDAPSATARAQVGVVIHGVLGPRILVRENRIDGFRVGVRVVSERAVPSPRLWKVSENVFYRCTNGATGALSPPFADGGNVVSNNAP